MGYYFFKGALTAKSYSFIARPWEFKNIDSTDFFDPVGSSIRIDIRGDKIIRIIPRLNNEINNEWVSDKIRFAVDGFRNQRIDSPLIKLNDFVCVTWFESLLFMAVLCTRLNKKIKHFFTLFNNGVGFFTKQLLLLNYLAGSFTNFENEYSINMFLNTFFLLKVNPKTVNLAVNRKNFFLTLKISAIKEYGLIILAGINVRHDYPVFNIRLRQHSIKNNVTIINFGVHFVSTFRILYLGSLRQLYLFCNGSHWLSSSILRQKTLFFINELLANNNGLKQLIEVSCLANLTSSVLIKNLTSLITYEVGSHFSDDLLKSRLVPSLEILNSLPVQTSPTNSSLYSEDINMSKFQINFSHHGDARLLHSNLILPIPTLFEKEDLISNIEGRICPLHLVSLPPQNALPVGDSLILLFTLILKLTKTKKHLLLLNLAVLNLYLIQVNSNLIWGFVDRFLVIHSYFSLVSVSSFLKQFQLFSVFKSLIVDNETFLESFEYTNKFNNSLQSINQFNKLTTLSIMSYFKVINTNYYVQDEICSSSFTLTAANERLLLKSVYY